MTYIPEQCRYRRCRRFVKSVYCKDLCVMGEGLALMEDDRKTALVEGMMRGMQNAVQRRSA